LNLTPQFHSVQTHEPLEPAFDKGGTQSALKDSTIKISLTDFVDFATRSGKSQFTKVKELFARGEYDPRTDFWKPLRDCIPAFHRGKRTLESVVATLTDAKKTNRYPQAIAGYRRFLGKNEPNYFTVPAWFWTYGELHVRVNPEVGFEMGGKRYAVKLHFKDEKLTRQRSAVLLEVMRSAMAADSKLIPAILDVANARLISVGPFDGGLTTWLQAQAVGFVHMWNLLAAQPITIKN
jgi:hypothetical protein